MILSVIFLIQIVITILFSTLAAILDVKCGSIPDKLTYSLLVYGVGSNLILSIITGNVKFIIASIISMAITNYIVYMLWELNMWGGGDVKLFTAIAAVIPFGLNVDFLNIFPQLSVYPFAFTVVINSVLVSFPVLLAFLIHVMIKDELVSRKRDVAFNAFNADALKFIINSTMNRRIKISDLREGNVVNKYYFNNEHIIELIEETGGNLEIFENREDDEFKYYFKSSSAGGITSDEVMLLKIMNAQEIISKDISVKVTFPFTPAIMFGLFIAVFYGDIMFLFTKNLFLVV